MITRETQLTPSSISIDAEEKSKYVQDNKHVYFAPFQEELKFDSAIGKCQTNL